MRRFATVLLLAVMLAAGAGAQPSPSCPGDCDLDGDVQIDELLRGVNFLLAGDPPSGCEEIDDDRDGQVIVNEIILAVLEALNGCRLAGDAAGEAAAAAAVGAVDAFQVLDIGGAAAGGSGGGGAAAADLGAAGGQTPPCDAGGTIEESCSSDASSSRLTIIYDQCRSVVQRLELVLDGRLVRTVDDGLYCSTRQIADGTRVMDELSGFRQTISDREDGAVLFDFGGTYIRRYTLNGSSCAGRDSTEMLDGRLELRCDPGGASSVCPPQGRDLSLVARSLTVIRAGRGETTCVRSRTLLGRLESRDRISGQAFDAVYRQFVITDQAGAAPVPIQLNGAVALDCLGELSINSEIPILRAGNARCPTAGLLLIRLPDGVQRSVRYAADRIALDLDGDGRPDRSAPSCEDPSLARCE